MTRSAMTLQGTRNRPLSVLILHRRSWCRACVGSGSTVGQTQHASPNHAHPRARISESCAPPPNHAHLRIRIPASYASPHTHPRTRIPAYASPQTKYAYAHPHSKPKSSRLRAHVEVALRRDFIHAQGFHVPRRVQHFRGARALVQGNNLGFVPHPVVGPVELGFFNWSCEGDNGVNGGVKVGKVSWGRSAGDEKAIVFGKTKLPKNCQNLGW